MAESRPEKAPTPVPASAGPPSPTTPEEDEKAKAALDGLITSIEGLRKSRVIVYWLSLMGKVSSGVVPSLYDQLRAIGKTNHIDLVLFTAGGDVDVPIRIVTLIREYCERFSVLLPHRAQSAGTLLAIGADEIVMTPLSVLGPIDPARTHPLLPRREGATESEPISVQDMKHAMEFIRKAAGEGKEMPYTPEAMAQIFTALFEKIHPLAIGAIEQSYSLAKLVGKKCLSTHMDSSTEGAKIDALVDQLCDAYKSHAFEIGRREAQAIGLKAVDAEPAVEEALVNLLRFFLARPLVPKPLPPKGGTIKGNIAWLESTALHLRVDAIYQLEADGTQKYRGDEWVAY